MTIIIPSIIKKSNNSSLYVPNQFIPFLCVFIIAKTPTFLLVSFALGYIMLVQPKKKQYLVNREIKMIEATPSLPPSSTSSLLSLKENDEEFIYCHSSNEEDESKSSTPIRKLTPTEDNNSSIEFENLLKFPSCPTTLPRLDTHFNFVSDHDIQSPDPSKINWSAIHQEMEYDQQRQEGIVTQQRQLEKVSIVQSQHPLLLLHQLQQENISMIFSEDELSSVCSSNKPVYLNSPAILNMDNDADYSSYQKREQQQEQTNDTIHIEDLLMLPRPKQSVSSPGQLFKSKFQKAVSKIKKTSTLVNNKHDTDNSKRLSVISNGSSTRSESFRLNSSQEPYFLSPRPSASARVQDHLKDRFNKLFKK